MSTEKKLTAVEWLVNEIEILNKSGYEFHPKYNEGILEQAKELEKQQIIDAFEEGALDIMYSQQYYEQTFKN